MTYTIGADLNDVLRARLAVKRSEGEMPSSAAFSKIGHFNHRRKSAQTIRYSAKCGGLLRKPEITPQSTHCAPFMEAFCPPIVKPTEAAGRAVPSFLRSAAFRILSAWQSIV